MIYRNTTILQSHESTKYKSLITDLVYFKFYTLKLYYNIFMEIVL